MKSLILIAFLFLLVGWQVAIDPFDLQQQQDIDLLKVQVATLEAWAFTPTNEVFATPIPVNTPTPEINVLMWVVNDSVVQRIRSCAGITGCPITDEISANAGFWVCLDNQLNTDGYLWGRVYNVEEKQYTALRTNSGTQLVIITSERETLPATDRGCDQ